MSLYVSPAEYRERLVRFYTIRSTIETVYDYESRELTQFPQFSADHTYFYCLDTGRNFGRAFYEEVPHQIGEHINPLIRVLCLARLAPSVLRPHCRGRGWNRLRRPKHAAIAPFVGSSLWECHIESGNTLTPLFGCCLEPGLFPSCPSHITVNGAGIG